MKHYVWLSFGVLGWAFFEMSGGTDFQPPVNPALAMAPSGADSIKPATIETTALVLPAATKVTPTRAAPVATPAVVAAPEVASLSGLGLPPLRSGSDEPVVLVSLEQDTKQFGGLLEGFDPNGIRASISQTQASQKIAAEPVNEFVSPPPDLRTVSGTRVNMRSGPGTNYGVISRLTLGEEVEVLDDSVFGWLQLRQVSNRTVGWISASLISKPGR